MTGLDHTTAPTTCVLACSGCSPAGELADHTARHLHQLGVVRMSCLAGVGARVSSIVTVVRKASSVLMIDGCPLECGAHVLRQSGFPDFKHLRLHEHDIRKNDPGVVNEANVARLAVAALRLLNQLPKVSTT